MADETTVPVIDQKHRRRRIAAGAVVFLVALGTYLPNLGNDFAMDDKYNVVGNERIRSLGNIPNMFTGAWASEAGGYETEINRSYYRPVSEASLAVDYSVHGRSPRGYHLTNDLLHATCCLLIFFLLLGVGVSTSGALLGGLWFAVHPVHTEAVHLVTYRTELLATAGALLALVAHLKGRGRLGWAIVVPIAYALSLGAKESAVTVPGIIVLIDLARGIKWRVIFRRLAPLAVVLVGYLAVREVLLTESPIRFFNLEPPLIAASVLAIYGTYIRLLLWPWPLCPFYDWGILPPADSLTAFPSVLGLLLLLGTVFAAVRFWRSRPMAGVAIGFWLIALIPFAHLVPLPVGAAERFLYFPSAGIALLIAVGWDVLAKRWRRPAVVAAGAVLAVYLVLSVVRAGAWADNETLLEQTATDFPTSVNAPLSLGDLHCRSGNLEGAVHWYAETDRRYPAFYPNIERWARCLADAGEHTQAAEVVAGAQAMFPEEAAWGELLHRLGQGQE